MTASEGTINSFAECNRCALGAMRHSKNRGFDMPYAVVRHYVGAQDLIDELGRRAEDVRSLISGIDGFISYALVRTDSGGYSVSIYETSEGAEESTRRAREYIKQNLSDMSVAPPEVLGGETIIHFNR